jgi:ATP-dependent protease Clp ATPase subunit
MTIAQPKSCSFCRKRQHEVRLLITNDAGSAAICDRCVEQAVEAVDRERAKKRKARLAPAQSVETRDQAERPKAQGVA